MDPFSCENHSVRFIPYSPFPKAKTTRKQKRYCDALFLVRWQKTAVRLGEPLRAGKQNRMRRALLFDPSGCKNLL